MRPNQQLAYAIGGALGTGLDAYQGEKERLRQLDRQAWQDQMTKDQFAQQQAAHARNQYIQELEFGAKQAEALLSQGQHERAATLYNDLASRGHAHGFNLGAPVSGGTKLVPDGPAVGTGKEQARPKPAFVGPMPQQMNQPMKSVRDFSNAGTLAAIRGGLGLSAGKPAGFELNAGQSYYTIGPDGKPALSVTAPYGDNPYKVTADEQIRLKEAGLNNAVSLATLRAANALTRTAMTQSGADRRAAARRGGDDGPDALEIDAKITTMAKAIAGPADAENPAAWEARFNKAYRELAIRHGLIPAPPAPRPFGPPAPARPTPAFVPIPAGGPLRPGAPAAPDRPAAAPPARPAAKPKPKNKPAAKPASRSNFMKKYGIAEDGDD